MTVKIISLIIMLHVCALTSVKGDEKYLQIDSATAMLYFSWLLLPPQR